MTYPNLTSVEQYLALAIGPPSKLKAAVMAAHFNTTADYIGPYFKRNAGITLREYISQYHKSLIQKRIESGIIALSKSPVDSD